MNEIFRDAHDLLCPVCGSDLSLASRTLSCPEGHRFDAAKQGYFNLLTGRGTVFREDTADMVASRAAFLEAGHYEPLAAAIVRLAYGSTQTDARTKPLSVIDAGAGTGYYLDRVLRSSPTGSHAVALDISKFAMRRAAKVEHALALVWDLWRPLPLAAGCADVLLNVFAPRNGTEFARVLRPGGVAIVVTPLPGHLGEAAKALGLLGIAEHKAQSVTQAMGDAFTESAREEVTFPMSLGSDQAMALALMGPAGHHLDAEGLRASLETTGIPSVITAAFRIQVFLRS
ncbi:putative RNA methyltransferase [Paeniglutamicibacter cryotolerans]|uniref:23S rRNA (Guanine745-N1)-methyltransferase n=1 Tax=Paeniglutamicibacter cryotolerans TaxID=670079 RepID=A0A839QLW7_9MICC|nr:SAM-dependent methyltransferase [Paeniglutamicibacter cryotolerans]MBB2997229.1 23S rRNA (guanine745-N1)-methyltransferase [Paeniglutamicibacter cryotolerans]